MSKKKPLPDILKTPLFYKDPFLLSIERSQRGLADRLSNSEYGEIQISVDAAEKLKALFDYYGIEPQAEGADLKLALALATDYIPGFSFVDSEPRKKGRPNRWMGSDGLTLFALVKDKINQNSKLSVEAACKIISKNGYFKDVSEKSLPTRYYEVIQNHIAFILAKQHCEHTKKDFESFMRDYEPTLIQQGLNLATKNNK